MNVAVCFDKNITNSRIHIDSRDLNFNMQIMLQWKNLESRECTFFFIDKEASTSLSPPFFDQTRPMWSQRVFHCVVIILWRNCIPCMRRFFFPPFRTRGFGVFGWTIMSKTRFIPRQRVLITDANKFYIFLSTLNE